MEVCISAQKDSLKEIAGDFVRYAIAVVIIFGVIIAFKSGRINLGDLRLDNIGLTDRLNQKFGAETTSEWELTEAGTAIIYSEFMYTGAPEIFKIQARMK